MNRYSDHKLASCWFLLAVLALAAPLFAQTDIGGTVQLTAEPVDESAPPKPAPPVSSPPVSAPTESPSKAPAADELDVQPILEVDPDDPYRARPAQEQPDEPELVPEGKRLFHSEGRITRVDNETRFVFASGEPPMTLLPSKPLERMEELSRFGSERLVFRVSGVVTEYRKRNYLLLTDYPRLSPEEEAEEEEEPQAPLRPGESAVKPPAETAAETSEKSDEQRDTPPAPVETRMPDVQPERPLARRPREAGSPSLLPEDKRLIDREGRIVREAALTVFVFDNGDKPVVLMPNKKLERMENLAEYGRSPVRFRISGRITEYRGRNYLLMSKMVVIPKAIEKL